MSKASSSFGSVFAVALLVPACVGGDHPAPTDLGSLGDGKADSFGVVDQQLSLPAGGEQAFTFDASSGFRILVAQPDSAPKDRAALELELSAPDGTAAKVLATAEPRLVADDGATGTFTLTVHNTASSEAHAVLNVRTLAAFGDLPHPNASSYPDGSWAVPGQDAWPATYVIFNNPGCGRTCSQDDQSAVASRSVMIKMLVSAIENVKDGGIVRVSNYNISGSQTAKPVVDALVYAMQQKHASVRIVMDDAQNNATSKTTWLAQNGAEVRFLNGLSYASTTGGPTVGIMHSKIVAVDDQVVFTGSNNFSGAGFVTNEENSVVLRAPDNSTRITSFVCDIDKMFDVGVASGQPQRSDADRQQALLALDQCNGSDVWFPPTGVTATGKSVTATTILRAISGANRSISIAPDMLASPPILYAIIDRAQQLESSGRRLRVRLVLDASDEALGNPAFGDCLAASADAHGYDFEVRYWHGNPMIFQLMHHKFMVIDEDDPENAVLYNGSANYSARAMSYSFENVTRYQGPSYRAVVDAFTGRFARMFGGAEDKATLASEGVTIPSCPLDPTTL
jgi:phosphatidylserine/phosphatidylglycerophosphate/cardiolipin synthase-like enzyme